MQMLKQRVLQLPVYHEGKRCQDKKKHGKNEVGLSKEQKQERFRTIRPTINTQAV